MRKFALAALVTVSACAEERSPERGVDTTLPDLPSSITGTVSYPSDVPPEDIEVCAETSKDRRQVLCVPADAGSKFSLPLAPGNYLVFARSKQNKIRAYYTPAVSCGLSLYCEDHEPIVVKVTEGQVTSGIDPGDWFNLFKSPEEPNPANESLEPAERYDEGEFTEMPVEVDPEENFVE
ncbi:hypothetical protein [Sphingomonas mesophila]|uniref:hypothetical protein n=1 Tax=Sphingomonas mesophila TaxID=2303576 RepID=UPI0013C2C7D8|nr:hypothetical protein [Sphingomonas mesophila]